MKKYMWILPVALMVCSGCFFSRGKAMNAVNYLPELAEKGTPVFTLRSGAVSNISGAGREFLLRGSDSTVKIVPEMRWLNAPEAMLKSAMLMKFAGNEQTPAVSAQIVRFEFTPDFRSLEAVIVFSVRSEKNIVCAESVPVRDKDYGKAAAELFCRVINKVITAAVKK